jgi:DNA repair exonuclease SbcCD nuclease subunit
MSKILFYTDPHWSQYSSIVRKRGKKYSQRLENLIESVNWAENLSQEQKCDMVICLGDFFDSPTLNSEELTALQEIIWNKEVPHYFLVGNHESSVSSLEYNSTKALQRKGFYIVDGPQRIIQEKADILLLPYILEENRKTIKEYWDMTEPQEVYYPEFKQNRIILSHNDILGIRYGKFESKEGFDLKEIEEQSELFLNGHLHNGVFLNKTETILNLGNLTGQNFSEDASKYKHYAVILDTESMNLDFYENPNAFNFYHLDVKNKEDFIKLNQFKDNSIVTFRCKEELINELKDQIKVTNKIIEHKIIVYRDLVLVDETDMNKLSMSGMDYLEKFTEFILQTVGDSEIVKEELTHISGGNS